MSYWIRCNSCFHPPSTDRKLAVTTCGHLICNHCYQKGKQGTCLVCSSKCQVSPLSDNSSSQVKMLFVDINSVASKHLTEISKVILFQARHQKRLLTYYQQRNEKLEQTIVKMKQEMQQMMKKLNEQSTHIKKLENSFQHQSVKASVGQMNHSFHTLRGHQSALQIPFNSPMSVSHSSSTANLVENMEMDETNLFRKPINATRLTLTSPLQDGWKGTVSHRMNNQNLLANHSASSATVCSYQTTPSTPEISFSCSLGCSPIFKPPSTFRHSSMSSLINLPP